ncbi:hypothetical protein [Sulfitobacter sp.]|uniref:hypothetical protein n=1 Tax=Sulfitobacter sp. TaxID=1903071 RepID=UPI0035641B1A
MTHEDTTREYALRPSIILDHLVPDRATKFETSAIKRKRRSGNVAVELKDMSFTHNPRETMNRLGQLADMESDAFGINIDFHDTHCLDVGPYLLLSTIKKGMPGFFLGGEISSPMSKVMNALELDQELGIWVPVPEDMHTDVFPFPVHRRRQSGSTESETRFIDRQTHEKVAGNLKAAIDNWLGVTTEQKLNLKGRRSVYKLVTETLDNAERHGDLLKNQNDGDWIVAGFMARRGSGENEYYRCHLAFLSTGTTISETIRTTPDPTKSKLNEYVARHNRQVGTKKYASEHLSTVFALQDGVTRSEIAVDQKRNGTGFQDILEFYSDLAAHGADQANASMAIVSGRTCVLCNAPYMHGVRMGGDDSEREMWFNESNTQELPPDHSNVIELDRCLKGTLISMAFTLDLDYLERTVDRAN